MMIIEFKDRGQVFHEWLVDENSGKILDCKPCGARNWVGKYVFTPHALDPVAFPMVHVSEMPIRTVPFKRWSKVLLAIEAPIKSIKPFNPYP